MTVSKSVFWMSLIVLVIAVLGYVVFSMMGSDTNSGVIGTGEDIQVVKMYTVGGNYVFEPNVVQKDVLVRLEADMSRMPGCSRSVVSPALGIRKIFTASSNIVEFIPTQSGTFGVACSMNMYRGSLIVQ
jgi:plastocyanin domain-containing protein